MCTMKFILLLPLCICTYWSAWPSCHMKVPYSKLMRRTCGYRQAQQTLGGEQTDWLSFYLGLHVHEVQPLGVHADVDAEHLVVAGAGLGVDLAREEGRSVRGDVPAVLQEESLQVVHLFTDPLAGAQGLAGDRQQTPSASRFQYLPPGAPPNRTLYSCRIRLVQW